MNIVNVTSELRACLSRLPLRKQEEMLKDAQKCIQKIQEDAREVLRQEGIAYLDPTYDRTFKWLMGEENGLVARTIFDSLVFLAYKGLETRQVQSFQSMSQQLDAMTEQLKHLPSSNFQALTMDVPVVLALGGESTLPAVAPRRDLDSAIDGIIGTLRDLLANVDIVLKDHSRLTAIAEELIEKLNDLKVLGARIEKKMFERLLGSCENGEEFGWTLKCNDPNRGKLKPERYSMVP